MVYLAASMRKIRDYHIEELEEYRTYISNFFDSQEGIRTGESRVSIQERTNRLVQSNTVRQITDDYSQDENFFSPYQMLRDLVELQNRILSEKLETVILII